MDGPASVRFFDRQFRRQIAAGEGALNPFEAAVLPHLAGRVLDFGCGLGNLALAAARAGCTVVALDASATAIAHLASVARRDALPIMARVADLREQAPGGEFDCAVSIGLLMFFDCATAARQLRALQRCVRPGGIVAVNTLVDGTTWLDPFGDDERCLMPADAIDARFDRWPVLHRATEDFAADGGRRKRFVTLVARKPA